MVEQEVVGWAKENGIEKYLVDFNDAGWYSFKILNQKGEDDVRALGASTEQVAEIMRAFKTLPATTEESPPEVLEPDTIYHRLFKEFHDVVTEVIFGHTDLTVRSRIQEKGDFYFVVFGKGSDIEMAESLLGKKSEPAPTL